VSVEADVSHRSRRAFSAAAAAAMTSLALPACSFGSREISYTEAVQATWRRDQPVSAGQMPLLEELVRCATLAPSSHNTQCWKFALQDDAISIIPDLSRRCPAVDPDDHHLFVSLGCATENLTQAALAHGLRAETRFDAAQGDMIHLRLTPREAVATDLFAAIFERQSTRSAYDGQPLAAGELKLLERAGTGEGVQLLFLDGKPSLESMLAYVVEANTAQMRDAAFVEELKRWIRFSDTEAIHAADGLFTGATGNTSTPRWLGELLFSRFYTPEKENDKYVTQIRSSAGIAVFAADKNDKEHWIEVGRCYERFALQATALGIRNAFINQPVEVAGVQSRLSGALGLGERRADLVVRFGRGPEMPRSLRRPVEAVLV
jgi:hypothetical protein